MLCFLRCLSLSFDEDLGRPERSPAVKVKSKFFKKRCTLRSEINCQIMIKRKERVNVKNKRGGIHLIHGNHYFGEDIFSFGHSFVYNVYNFYLLIFYAGQC